MADNPPLLPFASWPSFPLEGDLRLKPLDEPVEIEPARHGENPAECLTCNAPDEAYIWVSERWRVRSLDRPTGLPVVLILEPRSHLDLGDLPNLLAAELGVLTVRVERAIRSLDDVVRVHVNRWGDSAFHLQVWFLARPYGRLQLQGTFLSMWNEILPPVLEDRWRENLALIAAWLEEFGGRALAEPPRINWTAPSRFDSESSSTPGDAEDLAVESIPSLPGTEIADAEERGETETPDGDTGSDGDASEDSSTNEDAPAEVPGTSLVVDGADSGVGQDGSGDRSVDDETTSAEVSGDSGPDESSESAERAEPAVRHADPAKPEEPDKSARPGKPEDSAIPAELKTERAGSASSSSASSEAPKG